MTSLTTKQRSVTIGDQYCKVHLTQAGMKTVWYASGEICGQFVQRKARSESAALQAWVDAANDVARRR